MLGPGIEPRTMACQADELTTTLPRSKVASGINVLMRVSLALFESYDLKATNVFIQYRHVFSIS